MRHGDLHLAPRLPQGWQQLDFPLCWQGVSLHITLDAQQIRIRSTAPVTLYLNQQPVTVDGELTCLLRDYYLPTSGTATTEGH